MRDLSIDSFWKKKFGSLRPLEITPLDGWVSRVDSVAYFVEPELTLRKGFSDLSSKIWLVSAPGAVGKSTLARQIAHEINALYIDLSRADTIGGNYIYGGLAKTNSQESWKENSTTLFIDALDEARLRVTIHSFNHFLKDLIEISSKRQLPIVLFGRSGIIDEIALYTMIEFEMNPTIFDIEYFDPIRSIEFVKKHISDLAKNKVGGKKIIDNLFRHRSNLDECINKLIDSLNAITKNTDNSFSGYSPVLHAVSTFILSEGFNISKIRTEIDELLGNRILEKICRAVLQREQSKLKKQIVASSPSLSDLDLYNIDEQITYLVECIKGNKVVPMDHSLGGCDQKSYMEAVENLIIQHPFLAGDGKTPANAVFEAAIITYAMRNGELFASTFCESTVNPLLAEFYFHGHLIYGEEQKNLNVEPSHVFPIFNSILARTSQGNKVEMSIEAEEDADLAEVTICRFSQDTEAEDIIERFFIPHRDKIAFYDRISNVYIDAPSLSIELHHGDCSKDFEFITPVSIYADRIDFLCKYLYVRPGFDLEHTITLEAINQPCCHPERIVCQNVNFAVSWPNDRQHPWSTTDRIGTVNVDGDSDNLKKALLSFSRIVRAFRSHGKGEKKRFVDKIDHSRMLKNFGKEILDKLMKDSIIDRSGIMYTLNTDKLGDVTGTSYLDAQKRDFCERAIIYIRNIVG